MTVKRLLVAVALYLLALGAGAQPVTPGITEVTDGVNNVFGAYKLQFSGGTVSNPGGGEALVTISGGGTGCTPSGGSATNIVLYGAGGLCSPALDANITNGGLTLGIANSVGGILFLEGSSSGSTTLTAGTSGTFTSGSPWHLSGLFTLTDVSNVLTGTLNGNTLTTGTYT